MLLNWPDRNFQDKCVLHRACETGLRGPSPRRNTALACRSNTFSIIFRTIRRISISSLTSRTRLKATKGAIHRKELALVLHRGNYILSSLFGPPIIEVAVSAPGRTIRKFNRGRTALPIRENLTKVPLNTEAKLQYRLYSLWAPIGSSTATAFVSCLKSIGVNIGGKVKQPLQVSFAGFS
jgi:hypothetical protein